LTLEYNSPMADKLAQQLKNIREEKGLSLEDIAYNIHVQLDYLKAIEAGEADSILSPIQIKGFLRLYANEIGVNLEELQKQGVNLNKGKLPDEPGAVEQKNQTGPETQILKTGVGDEPNGQNEDLIERITLDENSFNHSESYSFNESQRDSSKIFTEIGDTLRSRRELINLSINDIHQNTHVRKEYLSAIESGEFHKIPSTVQAKGMLQNYAEFLGLDVDAILLSFSEALQRQRLERLQSPDQKKSGFKELSPTALRLKNFFTLDLLVILTLLLMFAVFVVWGVNRIIGADSDVLQADNIPGVSDILLATATPTPELINDLDDDGIVENEQTADDTAEDLQDADITELVPALNTGPINIVIIPRQRTWVQITVDDEIIFEGRLLAGNAYDYSGEDMIEVRTGNAGALQIIFNEEDIGALGLISQVVTITFTESGIILPTPTITPTFTNTPEFTPTPSETPIPDGE
jgi:cytoskeleton protein RodZ